MTIILPLYNYDYRLERHIIIIKRTVVVAV